MSDGDISRFHVPTLDEMPDDMGNSSNQCQKSQVCSQRLRCSCRPTRGISVLLVLHDTLMTNRRPLQSRTNSSSSPPLPSMNACTASLLTERSCGFAQKQLIADQVAINPAKATLSQRERDIVNFALHVATDSPVTDAEIDDMRTKGFTDDEIWDIAQSPPSLLSPAYELQISPAEFCAMGR